MLITLHVYRLQYSESCVQWEKMSSLIFYHHRNATYMEKVETFNKHVFYSTNNPLEKQSGRDKSSLPLKTF